MGWSLIGVDPSLTACGLAAIDFATHEVTEWECIRTQPDAKFKPTEDLARRLTFLAQEVRRFTAGKPGVIVVEGQVGASFGKSSLSTTFLLGAAYGAVLGALPTKPIVIHSATIKSRVMGNRDKTTKQGTWDAVKGNFTAFPPEPKNKVSIEAVHDAVITAFAAEPEIKQLQAMMPL